MIGAELVCATLRSLGAGCVFGLPGTQNTALYEALRTSGLRAVVAADEGGAAFMAAGYARAGGGIGVLTTIPGPGFLYALPAIAEAREDSVPVVWVTLKAKRDEQAFPLQAIDQPAIATPLVKMCFEIGRADDIDSGLREAWRVAAEGEPGPVLVELGAGVLAESATGRRDAPAMPATAAAAIDAGPLLARLRACERPLIYAGQGAQGAAAAVARLARRLGAPVLFTCSGRGVLPDNDPLAFVRDFSIDFGTVVPEMIERADLVLVLGCKFTHNGSSGGRLALPRSKLARIDSSAEVLAAGYPASLAMEARIEDALAALGDADLGTKAWPTPELDTWRRRLHDENRRPIEHEPVLVDCGGAPLHAFFDALGAQLGAHAIYTADAGLHQALTRRYARVLRPAGLLCPSDFQSMGFGLPGAIGAALAQPAASVVACIGDGGLALSAGELLTAVREDANLTIVVFNDESFGLIRRQQIANYGHTSGVRLRNPDFALLAQAVGCDYIPVKGELGVMAARIAEGRGVRLVELRLADVPSLDRQWVRSALRAQVRAVVPDSAWQALKRLLRG